MSSFRQQLDFPVSTVCLNITFWHSGTSPAAQCTYRALHCITVGYRLYINFLKYPCNGFLSLSVRHFNHFPFS